MELQIGYYQKEMPNLKLVKTNPILDKSVQANLRSSTLIAALRNKTKNHYSDLRNIISIIKNYITDLLYHFSRKRPYLRYNQF